MKVLIAAIGLVLLFALVFASPFTQVGSAAQSTSDEGYEVIAETFFELLEQEDAIPAVDYLFSKNPYFLNLGKDDLNSIRGNIAAMQEGAGTFIDHDLLIETKVTDRYVVQYYFAPAERQPFAIRLEFYKPYDEWTVQAFNFNEDIDEEIVTMTKDLLVESDLVEIKLQAPSVVE